MTGASLPPLPAEPEFCVVARWNLSLGARERWTLFAALAVTSLALAGAFAAAGAWPVLPYAALELGLLAWAFRHIGRRSAQWERLSIVGDRVTVERCDGGVVVRREWNRRWLRVEITAARFGRPPRLWLCFGSERWAFGEALPREARAALATELKRLAGR